MSRVIDGVSGGVLLLIHPFNKCRNYKYNNLVYKLSSCTTYTVMVITLLIFLIQIAIFMKFYIRYQNYRAVSGQLKIYSLLKYEVRQSPPLPPQRIHKNFYLHIYKLKTIIILRIRRYTLSMHLLNFYIFLKKLYT